MEDYFSLPILLKQPRFEFFQFTKRTVCYNVDYGIALLPALWDCPTACTILMPLDCRYQDADAIMLMPLC